MELRAAGRGADFIPRQLPLAPDTETTSTQLAAPLPTRDSTRSAAASRTDWSVDGALRIGGDIKAPKKIRDVRPAYPAEALAARVTGVVIIEARMGRMEA